MKNILKSIGPGIVVAATGIGAGDMIAATVGGAKYGYAILWAVVLGGVLKYVLNEGIGRWQLISGSSLISGWRNHLHPIFSIIFLIYLILWSFIVAAALIAATGLAAHSLIPALSINTWGIIHSVVAIIIVLVGSYKGFEKLMKVIIALMFLVVIISSIMVKPDLLLMLKSIALPVIPDGGVKYSLAIIGGVGGSVTLMSYGYWISEKGWKGKAFKKQMRIDLLVAYSLTTLFGVAIIILSADLKPELVGGSKIVVELANKMSQTTGQYGKWIFLVGFWGAVFSSMLGVWQGIPYIFSDFMKSWKENQSSEENLSLTKSKYYIIYLLSMAIIPISIIYIGKPVWLIMVYAVSGSLFMPFLALSLLYLNNKKSLLKDDKNSLFINVFLIINLILFLYLGIIEILNY